MPSKQRVQGSNPCGTAIPSSATERIAPYSNKASFGVVSRKLPGEGRASKRHKTFNPVSVAMRPPRHRALTRRCCDRLGNGGSELASLALDPVIDCFAAVPD